MNLKILKNTLLLFLTGIILTSCELQEEAIQDHNYSKNIKIYQKSFDELLTDKKFAKSFNKIPKNKEIIKSNIQGRTVMEQQYGFTITNTPVRVMQVGNLTSYTFHIERDVNDNSYFENLVVQNDSLDNTSAQIIKYTPYVQMTTFADHNSYNFEGNIEFSSIIYDDTPVNLTGKVITVCRSLWGTRCTANGEGHCVAPSHIPFSVCLNQNCLTQQFLNKICTTYDDGDTEENDDGGTGGVSSNNTGGGGGNNNPIYSDPVCGDNCIDENATDPCEKVKNQFTNNTTLQEKLNILSGLTSAGTENGFYKYSNSNTIQNATVGTSGAVQFPDVPNSATCTILAHTHNSPAASTYSIFSWADLEAFAQLLKQGKLDANNFTAFLATADGTYYALTIENTQNFLQFFALKEDSLFDMNIALKRVEQAKLYYGELASFNENIVPIIDINTNPVNDEKAFLDLLQDNNLGVSLLESNATFTTFEKVTHNKTTGNIDKTPCN